MAEQKLLTIWFFVGLMLTILGLIITSTGIYYIFHPQTRTALHELNPNLWWGLIMLTAGIIFLISSIRDYKAKK